MKEKTQLQVFLVFLFIVCSMAFAQASFAAITMTPTVEGYAASMFRPAVTPTVTNGAFDAVGKLFINGNTVTLPASLAPASNAASYAKNTLWSNPWLTGLALLAWPSSAGLGSDQVGGWQYTPSEPSATVSPTPGASSATGYQVGPYLNIELASSTPSGACYKAGGTLYSASQDKCTLSAAACTAAGYSGCYDGVQVFVGSVRTYSTAQTCPVGYYYYSSDSLCHLNDSGLATSGSPRPATLDDFLALPDPPIAALGDMAPQIGVPVSPPFYLASDVPIGSPYTKPDGSTAQPRAKISPATNGQVTVATYDQPLTDASGNPVTNPAPQPTPDPVQDQCQKYPDSVGCATLGTDSFAVPTSSVPLSFAPEAAPFSGACPAPINVLGQSISFASSCDAMTMIRPLVLAFAAVMAAFILLDTFRGAA